MCSSFKLETEHQLVQHGFPKGFPQRFRSFVEVQSHSRQQTSDLEGRFLQQLSSVRSEVDAQITGSSEKLLGALGRLQDETLRGNEGITTSLGIKDQQGGVMHHDL